MGKRTCSWLLSGTLFCATATAWGKASPEGEGDNGTPHATGGLGLSGTASDEPQFPAVPEKGLVRLTIKTDDQQVQLRRRVAQIAGSNGSGLIVEDLICRTPCGSVLDGRKGEEFYFGGKDVLPSKAFQVIDYAGNVEASVKPGSWGGAFGGMSLMTLGLLGVILGGTFVWIKDYRTTGLVSLGAGTAMMVGGWALGSASQTTIDLHPAP